MFSVIIPIYNRERSVGKAINSVLKQTFTDFELILVDDCSTDNSVQVISEIKDERIKIFKLKKNSGAAAARNSGIKQAKGSYVSFLDSDDYYDRDFLQKTYNTLSSTNEKVGFSWTGVRYFENKEETEYLWTPHRKNTAYLTFLYSLHIGTNSGITVKKEVFNACGNFRENLPAAEDTEFFLRITQKFDYIFIPEILINIHKDGSDRLSKNYKKIAKAYNIFLPEHFKYIDKNKSLQLKYYYKMMWLNYHLGNKTEARKFYSMIPGTFNRGKLKSLFTRILYEFLPLEKASEYHQKLSSV